MNAKLNAAFLASVIVAALVSAPASAEDRTTNSAPSTIVRYSDLDLSSSGGIHTLYGRIQNAAWRVCLGIVPPRNAESAIENAKCRRTLTDVAVGEVNQPALTALHSGTKPVDLTARR